MSEPLTRMSEGDPVLLDRVEDAVADIAAGKAVVVVDDEDRENEGDLIFAAVQGDARADGVHDPPLQRRDLRADAGATCSTGSRSR